MAERDYEVVVIGAGPGGEVCAAQLGKAGKRVAIVERERVGGECAFWACVPSKILLRSQQPHKESTRVPGSKAAVAGEPSFAQAAAWRTESVDNYDDAGHVSFLNDNKVDLLRGEARVETAGAVRVGDKTYTCDTIVIATGSEPVIPSIDGLDSGRYWTSREATAAGDVPKRLTIVGAGAVGAELAQVFARYGARVTLIESGEHVLPKEEAAVAKVLSDALKADGVSILEGRSVKGVHWGATSARVALDEGDVDADEVLVATGRRGRLKGINGGSLGIAIEHGFIKVDKQCRAAENVFAIGDVSGVSLFTHVAKYQGRIAARAILGQPAEATYDAIPRCVFTDPEVAGVGMTKEQAEKAGLPCSYAQVELTSVARANLYYEKPATGLVTLVADTEKRVLVGASIAGPMASEMLAFATMAIASRMSVQDLKEVVQPFLTFSETFFPALEALKF